MKKPRLRLLLGGLLALSAIPLLAGQAYAGAGWGNSTNADGSPKLVPTYYANSPIGYAPGSSEWGRH